MGAKGKGTTGFHHRGCARRGVGVDIQTLGQKPGCDCQVYCRHSRNHPRNPEGQKITLRRGELEDPGHFLSEGLCLVEETLVEPPRCANESEIGKVVSSLLAETKHHDSCAVETRVEPDPLAYFS
jgi:hypothetical protein